MPSALASAQAAPSPICSAGDHVGALRILRKGGLRRWSNHASQGHSGSARQFPSCAASAVEWAIVPRSVSEGFLWHAVNHSLAYASGYDCVKCATSKLAHGVAMATLARKTSLAA